MLLAQVMSGNVVMIKGTVTLHVGGPANGLRVMEIFEVDNGLVTAWCDRFDLSQGSRPMASRGTWQPQRVGCPAYRS